MRVAVVALLVLAAGCLERVEGPSTGPEPEPSTSPIPTPTPSPTSSPPPASVAIRALAGGQQGGIHAEERVVIHDRAAYDAFWSRVREDASQAPPEVDFLRSTVVGVTLGQKPDACNSVRVTSATDDGYFTTAEVTAYTAPPGMACASVVTYPWHLVALDGPGREVSFTTREVQGNAPGGTSSSTAPTPTPSPTPPGGPTPVAFTRIESGQGSAHETARVGSVTDAAAWSAFWRQHAPDRTVPEVDFASRTVAFVFLGAKGNSCWATRITDAVDAGGLTTVRHATYAPDPSMMCADVITYPYDIVSLEGAGRTVGFTEQSGTYPPPS